MIHICVLCGFVYEQTKGEPGSGIAAGTAWEDIPNGWRCPECGASKEDFEEIPMTSIVAGQRDS